MCYVRVNVEYRLPRQSFDVAGRETAVPRKSCRARSGCAAVGSVVAALSLPAIVPPADAATVRPASLTATFTDHVIPAGSTTVLTFAVVNREGSDDLRGLSFSQP